MSGGHPLRWPCGDCLGRKRPCKDRKEQALHKLGMDLYGKNLTREQQNDRIRLTEELNDYTDEEIVEIVRLLQEDDTGVVFLTPEGKKNIITKRTWEQSEERAGSLLPDYDPQRSFLNRKPAAYGEKGSVRPDFYKAGSSIEVKNYDLSSPKRMNNMVHVIAKQFDKRERHIPEGTEQVVWIDILGQNISNEQCLDMIKKIQERTDHKMKVWFLN